MSTMMRNHSGPKLAMLTVNDKHSKLNETSVGKIGRPTSVTQLQSIVRAAAAAGGEKICIAGGRHAMGSQQFLSAGLLLDMTDMNKVLTFDIIRGQVTVQAGIRWPDLIEYLQRKQIDVSQPWTIAQKQTGCDDLSIGGALSANIHGRGLQMAPLVADVECFSLVTASGEVVYCSRYQNAQLFRLAIGGYGLFGIIATVTLRLVRRCLLKRSVQVVSVEDVIARLTGSTISGALFGDFQFNIDDQSVDFLHRGILSTYTPTHDDQAGCDDFESRKLLSANDWRELIYLAHADKARAFAKYTSHYLASDGQTYLSDVFQKSTYFEDYHREIDRRTEASCPGSELISEFYVPRARLVDFMRNAAIFLKTEKANVIYGTVRLIERDTETYLPWATQNWACIVFNLHVDHSEGGLTACRRSFLGLLDLAIAVGGSYYLTYHKYADRPRIVACYPQMVNFLRWKKHYDPKEIFCSGWYRYLCKEFAWSQV